MEVQAKRVDAQRVARRWTAAGAVVVVGVDQRHRVQDGLDETLERGLPELGA